VIFKKSLLISTNPHKKFYKQVINKILMQTSLESIPGVRNDLTESQILVEIKQLNRHITIVEEVIKGLEKIGPIYSQESHQAIINKYELMHKKAVIEREDYRIALGRFH
jgi:hypothetical protein